MPFGAREVLHDGQRWLAVPSFPGVRGVVQTGFGYTLSFDDARTLRHLNLQLALGIAPISNFHSLRRSGHASRLMGLALHLTAGIDASLRVDERSTDHHLAFPVRVSVFAALGRVGVQGVASLGPRWDVASSHIGGQLTFGVGGALLFSGFGLPLQVEAVYDFGGALTDVWGMRVIAQFPFLI